MRGLLISNFGKFEKKFYLRGNLVFFAIFLKKRIKSIVATKKIMIAFLYICILSL